MSKQSESKPQDNMINSAEPWCTTSQLQLKHILLPQSDPEAFFAATDRMQDYVRDCQSLLHRTKEDSDLARELSKAIEHLTELIKIRQKVVFW